MAMQKWLLSSDQQIPYHDPRAVELWFKVMKAFKPDVVDYLGDQDDQACYSKYTEGRAAEFLVQYKEDGADKLLPYINAEAKGAKEFYKQTRAIAKKAELFVALGNHDIRIFDYVDRKLAEMKEQVTPNSLWGLDDLGYDYIYYSDRPKLRYGGLYAHHGMAITKAAGESVKADMDNFGVSIVRGHSHRLAMTNKTFPLRNETIRGYELGHMSDINSEGMGYTNNHNWQQGFAYAYIDGDNVHMNLVEIKNGSSGYSCVVDGKKFEA